MKTDFRNGSNINTGSSVPAHLSSLELPWMHNETRTWSKASQSCVLPSQCTAPILPTALTKWWLRQHLHPNWNAVHYVGMLAITGEVWMLCQLQQHLAEGNLQLKGWTLSVQFDWFLLAKQYKIMKSIYWATARYEVIKWISFKFLFTLKISSNDGIGGIYRK